MNTKQQGLSVDVFRHGTDSTNGGISGKVDSFTLLDDSIENAPFEPSEKSPAIKLVRRTIGDRVYVHAEPLEECPSNKIGYMFGGNFIFTSDSRFPNDYPIPIHDRSESQEDYNRLSA